MKQGEAKCILKAARKASKEQSNSLATKLDREKITYWGCHDYQRFRQAILTHFQTFAKLSSGSFFNLLLFFAAAMKDHSYQLHIVWKLLKMSHLKFSTNFCPFKFDMSGNTVWLFGLFKLTFVYSKCNVEWDLLCYFQTPCKLRRIL